MTLVEDYPANIAALLMNGSIDIGLVPVAIIPKLANHYVIGNHCIAATKAVASVCLFSNVPLQEIDTIILDYQSKTSIALCKLLCSAYWRITPKFEAASQNYINEIGGTAAAVVIGDRAFLLKNKFAFEYDLASEWIAFTALPFVFAAWVANKKISEQFITQFDALQMVGLNNLPAVIAENPYTNYNLHKYYTENISYTFSTDKYAGMKKFLSLIV